MSELTSSIQGARHNICIISKHSVYIMSKTGNTLVTTQGESFKITIQNESV